MHLLCSSWLNISQEVCHWLQRIRLLSVGFVLRSRFCITQVPQCVRTSAKAFLHIPFSASTHSTRQHSMVQTRAQERGAPLKKPGAYDTDAYYNEVDQGFGDVGVDQEPDAARTQADDKSDPNFDVSKDEMRTADTAAAEEPGADVPLKEDIADLKAGSAEDVNTAAKDGTPVGVVQTSRENMEAQEAFTGPGIEEGVSTIPDNKA